MARYILGLELGATRTKAVIFDRDAKVISSASKDIKYYFPQPGWVEVDAIELWNDSQKVIEEALRNGRISPEDIEAIGIGNQATTTVFWNKNSSEPIGRAIAWQDKRTIPLYEQLMETWAEDLKSRTGLKIIPTSTALRIRWLMENDRTVQKGLARDELLYGTVDSWLIWKFSGGSAHVTDLSNASVTFLVNAHTLNYDDWLLQQLAIPRNILPEIRSSSEIYTYTDPENFFGVKIPISGAIVDYNSAVISSACFEPGMTKITYDFGSSIILNTGDKRIPSVPGIDSQLIWAANGVAVYGLIGFMDISGSVIQWLMDGLGIISEYHEAGGLASQVTNSQGVYFVPALNGLGMPYSDPYARGTIFGITAGTTKHHIARAALEAMVYQTRDLFEIMNAISGVRIKTVRMDGVGVQSEFLAQFATDILGIPVEKVNTEHGVLGAVFMAGLASGYWETVDDVSRLCPVARTFQPRIYTEERDSLYKGWLKAVKRAGGWLKE
jgi:glycerol kinase